MPTSMDPPPLAEAGVVRALNILRTELVRAVQLAGCPNLANIEETVMCDDETVCDER